MSRWSGGLYYYHKMFSHDILQYRLKEKFSTQLKIRYSVQNNETKDYENDG